MFLGVDTGGTFTDFVHFGESGLRFHKVLSTPDDPSRAIEQGIAELGLDTSQLHLVHGSTVATNAILERKGVKTLFVTNKDLQDLLIIGRQTRPELYNLIPVAQEAWIDSDDCFGVSGRMNADGSELAALDSESLNELMQKLQQGAYEAIAICLLFSFLNPDHERKLAELLPEQLFISLSHQVLSEYREYERGATTYLNAYVGPLVQRYLIRLQDELAPKHLLVMHSAGGVMSAESAGEQAVSLVLSGPAGGLVAAQEVGRQTGKSKLLSFDMGGTSTDVALINGTPSMTTEGNVAGIPVALPMLDIHTIGAGGGSLAWIDEAGLPQVGPESAGAKPGPVCYGLGGTVPAVTDANLLLGRIPASAKLGGSMRLDRDAAYEALSTYGARIGLSAEAAAEAVIRIAEEHMAAALRVVSIQRGFDPVDFSLLCFGGAGGLHACSLADKLGMNSVVFPVASGAFSAMGMLAGRQQSEFSRTRCLMLDDETSVADLFELLAGLEYEAMSAMPGLVLSFEKRVDMRYAGQGFHITIELNELDENNLHKDLKQRFEQAHRQAYGHRLNRPVEMMTARLTAVVEQGAISFPALVSGSEAVSVGQSEVYGAGTVPHYQREMLPVGFSCCGPALIVESTSTLWLPSDWQMRVDRFGHLMLERQCM
ncbi:N-methylhydantoinase A [Mariprofundus micogutta]|uniref:N-methylhydantoinase A n=1 Tax=Mariprofundus micogutta TaxID=1921010 RepID=A0A1L8CQH8_9PROT|nr:hydantoinase/oxoprolinase family protein [Mariprofundus micogutta]GAV21182.1 N-methylhydantoinase A [Mariprofundus micogutta]